MIVQATWSDVIHVALNMRQDDYDEVMATRWTDCPFDFASDCMRYPGSRFAARIGGNAVMIAGIAMHQPMIGQCWMVGTNDIGKIGIEIAHATRIVINELFSGGHVHRVQAHSAANHKRMHRWLKRIGFTEGPRLRAFGKNGEDFIIFEIVKGDSNV